MCGIAGTLGLRNDQALKTMLGALEHRGPDDEGIYANSVKGVFLGHRRLSIIDVSSAGHQPMSDEEEGIWVSFNGEIYNYKELAADLRAKGYRFRSESDTEVLIHGYKAYGADLFEKIDGMWAIALYDVHQGKVLLARDCAGMKPFYFYQNDTTVLFASEIGALASALESDMRTKDQQALTDYLAHGYIAGTATAYKNIHAVPPSSVMAINVQDGKVEERTLPGPRRTASPASLTQATKQFQKLFADSVQATLQADVPVSIFLSGGIDSTLVAYHAHQCGARLRAFTIGFEHRDFDESEVAADVAKRLGFPHTVHRMRASDIALDINTIFDSFGEPFADTSSLPTYYLAKLARTEGYKVALSGDGADELFGGYPTHYLPQVLRYWRHIPTIADRVLESVAAHLPEEFTVLGKKEKLTRFLYGARRPYREAHGTWKRVFTDKELDALIPNRTHTPESFEHYFNAVAPSSTDPLDEAMKVDFLTFLAADCLVKSDICAMQHGVEVRAPFLNRAMVDFAWHLSSAFKTRFPETKILLRRALTEILPKGVAQLPKRGFVPPLAAWLLDELKEPMLDLLSAKAVAKIGFVDYTYVVRLVDEHLSQIHDHTKKLWSLMSLSRFYARTML